jgi:hypothetical protein
MGRDMRTRRIVALFVLVALLGTVAESPAKEKEKEKKKPPGPIGWCVAKVDKLEVTPKPAGRKKTLAHLGRGSLLAAYEVKQKGGRNWTRVSAVDPAKLTAEMGWVDSGRTESLPLSQFPGDGELLRLIGGAYLDDFAAAHTSIARYLVGRAGGDPLLVCFLGSPIFPTARLQVFRHAQSGLTLGPYLEVPFADMQSAIHHIEVRNLFGDGNGYLITQEVFAAGPANHGVNLVIRAISAEGFKTLWKAPIEIGNLGSFPAKIQALSPPERNIGAPGTVTKGDVEFRPQGKVLQPVWKGKVEFHAVGREEPVQTVSIEKVCAWDGSKFAPLR